MTTRTRPTTAEELLNMPDDGFRYELIRGELRKMVPFAGQRDGCVLSDRRGRIGMTTLRSEPDLAWSTADDRIRTRVRPRPRSRPPRLAFVRRDREEAAGADAGLLPRSARRRGRGRLAKRRLHRGGGEGRGLARRRHARGDRSRPAPARRKGTPLSRRHRRADGRRHADRRRRRARLEAPGQRHFRVGPKNSIADRFDVLATTKPKIARSATI